ncbi:hypothetical protein Q3G72_030181 [Acer saccharum]|nr:hypothetical protein Q3G72_030181 [Acer saccharum]
MSKLLVGLGPKPSPPIIVLIEICRSLKELKQIHAHTITNGLSHFTYITSKLLAFSVHSSNGGMHHAETIFYRIPRPNIFDFNSMIMGFSQNSQPEKGLLLFTKMRRLGIEPNARTFTALVQSLFSLSLLDQVYGLVIRFGHTSDVYVISSVINMYSKYGSVDLARRVFDESLNKNVVCWTSLITIGAFKEGKWIHDIVHEKGFEYDLELGTALIGFYAKCERVGRHVIDLEPQHSGRYVLLANIYATMGCWEDVIRLRKLMKKREVITVSAWSFIEIDGEVHKFLVNDKSHFHLRGIYKVLNLLRKELEGFSVVPHHL